jgi:PAS domain S-box-containing protein
MNRKEQWTRERVLHQQKSQALEPEIGEVMEPDNAARLLAAIVESCDDAIVSKDLNGLVTSWNSGAERIFGYRADEMIGQPITRIIPPALLDDERVIIDKIISGQRVDHYETLRLRKDGELIEVSLTVSPVKDITGRVIGAAKVVRDITDRKRTDRAVREHMEKALQEALTSVKVLSGLLPICAGCKRICNDLGAWQSVESYISSHTEAEFTHGMCPECAEKYGWTAHKKAV